MKHLSRRLVAPGAQLGVILLTAFAANNSYAFPTWSADSVNNIGNCTEAGCHGDFNGGSYTSLTGDDPVDWGMSLMDGHVQRFGLECTDCHSTGDQGQVFLNSSASTVTCLSCHGREEDQAGDGSGANCTGLGVFLGGVQQDCGQGAGLRQQHIQAGISFCSSCHINDLPTQVGEDVSPPQYVALGLNSCNDIGFGIAGLDNDGDGFRDGADSDCGPINALPVANDDTATTVEDTAVDIDILANDTDADGDTLSINSVDSFSVNNGTVSCATSCTYTPALGFTGTDTFTYDVTDGTGVSTQRATVTITVTAAPLSPVANASGPYTGTEGVPVAFSGSLSSDPDGNIVAWDWDFGDGNVGSGQNVQHSYAMPGNYTVTLAVTDNDGLTNSVTTIADIVGVANEPVANIGGPYQGNVNVAINFDGSASTDDGGNIVAWDWDFGDGTTGSGEMASHTYTTAGEYTVTLTVTDNDGMQSMASTTVPVYAPPVADPNGPYSALAGDTITFDGTGSIDPDASFDPNGGIVSYDWNFGDGTTGTGATVTHAYSVMGSYTVTLTVTDNEGETATATTTADITVLSPPQAALNGPYAATVGTAISFDASGSSDADGNIVSWEWNFGDGNTAIGEMVEYTYATTGSYIVTLTVTDNDGLTATTESTAEITPVLQPPSADPNGPYAAFVGDIITFDGTGSTDLDGSIVSYDWDFGDGTVLVDAGANPSYSYSMVGTYTVSLTVIDNDGLSSTQLTTAEIAAVPLVAPVANPNGPYAAMAGDSITFDGSASSDSDGNIVQYDWEFGDGTIMVNAGANPSHTYAAAGTYTVILTVIDNDGLSDTQQTSAEISPRQHAPVANDDTATTVEDTAVTIDVLANDTDADGDTLTINSFDNTSANGGTVSCATSCTYTPATGFTGTDTFTYDVTDGTGVSTQRATVTITVTPAPVAPVANASGPYTGTEGVPVAFNGSLSSDSDGSIVAWDWDFGDGNVGSGQNVQHSYAMPGNYTVTLTVTDNDGLTNSVTTIADIVGVANEPVANIGGPYQGNVNVAINFDGSGSTDDGGTITTWEWNFGDGTTGSGEMASHTYTAAGEYTVTLTVTDNDGMQSMASTTVQVYAPPMADPNGPYSALAGDTITFDGTGSIDPDASFDPNGGIVSYDWNFGDGTTGTGATTTHAYSATGSYTVTLTVTDNEGETATATTTADISVLLAPQAAMNGPYAATVGTSISFDASGSSDADGNIVSWEWNFGDGNTAIGEMVEYTYSTPGSYAVTLTVIDNNGLTSSAESTAEITALLQAPSANPNGPYAALVGETITFDGTGSTDADGSIVSYDWDFGDGTVMVNAGANPSYTYAAAGTYTVSLTVTDNDGLSNTQQTTATITDSGTGTNQPPTADTGKFWHQGQVDQPITFDGSGSSDPDGTIISWEWDFGDGSTGTGEFVDHTYTEGGFYWATLTVTDNEGLTSTEGTIVWVKPTSWWRWGNPFGG